MNQETWLIKVWLREILNILIGKYHIIRDIGTATLREGLKKINGFIH